jgi:methylated-DNA-protein-cysteine methyltransferase related protein
VAASLRGSNSTFCGRWPRTVEAGDVALVSQSAAFARIKRDLMIVVAAIPSGRLATNAAIAEFLDIVPRQVAFLLAKRNDELRESVPWWRVVGTDGQLGTRKQSFDGTSQEELLRREGFLVTKNSVIVSPQVWFVPTTRNTKVVPVRRADVAQTGA